MTSKSLIPCFPGGKGYNSRYFGSHSASLICDRPHRYDCYVAPFFGGGGDTFGHYHGCTHAIAGDVGPGVLAVARCWGNAELRRLTNHWFNHWKDEVLADPANSFARLKCFSDNGYRELPCYRTAASYLTLKRLVFGGVLRTNNDGELNVALSDDKLQKFFTAGKRHKECDFTQPIFSGGQWVTVQGFWGYQYEWPDNGIERLDIHHGWERAVQALADSDYSNALVVIDPPYYSPQQWVETRKDGTQRASKMTAAYPGHNPQSADEMALCVDCLDAVLATGKAGRIVVFNYYSDELDDAILQVIRKHRGVYTVPAKIGHLGGMNNAQQFHGRDVEAVWEIGGTRMFQDFDAVQQLNLVEV